MDIWVALRLLPVRTRGSKHSVASVGLLAVSSGNAWGENEKITQVD